MRALLDSLPQPKYVFTNCSEKHAELALQSMGLQVRLGLRSLRLLDWHT